MRVLVTGATSLLGRHTVDRLLKQGHEVATFQRTSGDTASSTGGPREFLGDIASRTDVRPALADQEAVIHLAAKVGVTGPWAEYERTNVVGTATLLKVAADVGVDRIVHVSSPSVAHGGTALVGSGAEPADPSTTRGFYATSKAQAELLALAASTASMPVVALRPHLVWGPGDQQLVGRIVARAKAGRLAMVGSGAALIDSTFVDNAADAFVAALDRAPALGGEAFVISNGQPRTVSELFARIVGAAGLDRPRRHVPTGVAFVGGLAAERLWSGLGRREDPPMTSFLAEQLSTAHWFDQRRTREALDWSPAVSLDEGFERLAAWYAKMG